ncbi:MAG: hypothetical protein AAGF48_12870 [Pseudomonadota bacterium]
MTDKAELQEIVDELHGSRWHLDKKVPIALIVTMVAQTLAVGIWVGTLSTRVSNLEEKAVKALDVGERVIRVEQNVLHNRRSLERVEALLDRNYPK